VKHFARRVAIFALVGCRLAPALAGQASLPPFLELRVPKPPTVAFGGGAAFLAYELHVTNFAPQTMTLTKVEVATGTGNTRRVVLAVTDTTLARNLSRPGMNVPAAERAEIAGGSRAVVWLWLPVDRAAVPAAVEHRVFLEQGAGDSLRSQQLDGIAVPVSPEAAPVGPPLRGGVWLTGNGPAPATGHRRSLIPIGGVPSIAQRFAIDYVKVGDDNRTFTGDSLKNASYHAYGQDALAVADGRVVAVKDSIPENVPGILSRAVPITLETVGGNHVIIDIGGGRYAFYAHLQPGSLRVRLGDRVRRGQVVGLVGNSGNSTEPHLHFHISDGTAPLQSEGLPYIHESFQLIGRCRVFTTGCERAAAEVRRRELPMGNMLIRFPE
jgi:murein DD-endopeptidase